MPITVHPARGESPRLICHDGRLMTVIANRITGGDPCPYCHDRLAANDQAELEATTAALADAAALSRAARQLAPVSTNPLTPEAKPDPFAGRANFTVTQLPEGLVVKLNPAGRVVRRKGRAVTATIDFRSDDAISRRISRNGSKWGKGRVTGSTTPGGWAVPARPGDDRMDTSGSVLSDLRSQDIAARKAATKTFKRGRRKSPRQREQVIARYCI